MFPRERVHVAIGHHSGDSSQQKNASRGRAADPLICGVGLGSAERASLGRTAIASPSRVQQQGMGDGQRRRSRAPTAADGQLVQIGLYARRQADVWFGCSFVTSARHLRPEVCLVHLLHLLCRGVGGVGRRALR